jgi:hypothetical protein
MQITAVDNENNLFRVEAVFTEDFVEEILSTDWLNLPWTRQEGQEHWPRRRINNSALSWIAEWDRTCAEFWTAIGAATGTAIGHYQGTAFWLDEPGFTCSIHTDGELPGSMQLNWIGAQNLGTSFYWYKDPNSLRFQTPFVPNSGYIMINQPNSNGYRSLIWHAMLEPVPENTFRVTSYSWLTPQ